MPPNYVILVCCHSDEGAQTLGLSPISLPDSPWLSKAHLVLPTCQHRVTNRDTRLPYKVLSENLLYDGYLADYGAIAWFHSSLSRRFGGDEGQLDNNN